MFENYGAWTTNSLRTNQAYSMGWFEITQPTVSTFKHNKTYRPKPKQFMHKHKHKITHKTNHNIWAEFILNTQISIMLGLLYRINKCQPQKFVSHIWTSIHSTLVFQSISRLGQTFDSHINSAIHNYGPAHKDGIHFFTETKDSLALVDQTLINSKSNKLQILQLKAILLSELWSN